LKITAEKDQQSQYVVRIEIEAAELDEAKGKAAKRLSSRVRIPGFRPGKAPRALVERFVGHDELAKEAANDLIPKAYKEALSQENIKPIGEPDVKIDSYDPLTIVATIPVEPTVTLGNYREIKFDMPVVEENEEEVEKTIQHLRDQNSTWEEPEEPRPAQENDQVELELQSIRDGEPNGSPFPRTGVLGKGDLLEKIDEQIIGMLVGEERTVEVARPKPQSTETEKATQEVSTEAEAEVIAETNAELETSVEAEAPELPEVETIPLNPEEQEAQTTKPLVFQVKLNSIKVKHEPELNDDFAATVSELSTLDELRDRLRTNLKAQAEAKARGELVDKVVKEVVALSQVEIPPIMIHSQIHALEENISQRLKQQKLSLDNYLQFLGKNHEDFHEELRPQAETQVRTTLIMQELARQEGITVDQKDLEREVQRLIVEYTLRAPEEAQAEEAKRLAEAFTNKDNLEQLTSDIFSRKLSERLLELATGVKFVSDELDLEFDSDEFVSDELDSEEKVIVDWGDAEPDATQEEVNLTTESSAGETATEDKE
jgi:trigger factor